VPSVVAEKSEFVIEAGRGNQKIKVADHFLLSSQPTSFFSKDFTDFLANIQHSQIGNEKFVQKPLAFDGSLE